MPIKILMPALSPTMSEGNLAKWLKKEGDKISPGDLIAEIETDKATMEIEASDEGRIAKIIVPEGSEKIKVNSLIALILEDDEDESALKDFKYEESPKIENRPTKTNKPVEENAKTDIPPIPVKNTNITNNFADRVIASPLAKRIAKDKNIDLSKIQGTGPHNRIIKADLENVQISSGNIFVRNPVESYVTEPSNIRKIIAARLLESKQNVPHFYLSIECNLDKLMEVRAQMNEMAGDPAKYRLSVNDFIIKASALAIQKTPEVNCSWVDNRIVTYNNIDISIAVAAPSGLITPIIRNADQQDVKSISSSVKSLVKKAKENSLKPEEFQGGGFSISNLGMYGIKNFSAIINPPQSCILAIGAGNKRPVIINDELEVTTMMDATLSCDHRVVDGALGAIFLQKFKYYIENPIAMIVN